MSGSPKVIFHYYPPYYWFWITVMIIYNLIFE